MGSQHAVVTATGAEQGSRGGDYQGSASDGARVAVVELHGQVVWL